MDGKIYEIEFPAFNHAKDKIFCHLIKAEMLNSLHEVVGMI